MTKIALISDLHLEERKDPPVLGTPLGIFQVYGSLSLPREIDADVLVIAGDTHPNPEIRRHGLTTIEDELDLPIIHVNGNHDYDEGSFPNDQGELITMGGIRFAVAPLWTYLDDTSRHEAARFPDFVKIQGTTVDKWNDLHLAPLTFQGQAEADVIVTHYAPFPGSVHEDFQVERLREDLLRCNARHASPQQGPKWRALVGDLHQRPEGVEADGADHVNLEAIT